MIAALAFVPLDRVMKHFERLQKHFSDAVTPVLDCFEDNYVERQLLYGRRPPIFAHSLWNMYARSDMQRPRMIMLWIPRGIGEILTRGIMFRGEIARGILPGGYAPGGYRPRGILPRRY